MKKLSAADIIACVLILILVALTLAPALARMHRTAAEAKCQSNLRRWAQALALYTPDYQGRFPPNRRLSGPNQSVTLSEPGADPATGDPIRFQHGIAWVETLYPYIIDTATRTDQDWLSFMKCPNASETTYPANSATARMTYIFNFCLAEQLRPLVRNPEKLMMLREMDRNVDSLCRPIFTTCTGNSNVFPGYALLNEWEVYLRYTDNTLHADGSYIVFADGHVKYFSADFYPTQSYYKTENCWDEETQQWYNYGPNADAPPEYIKSIAITP